jgi:structural maintenance of chromosome 1
MDAVSFVLGVKTKQLRGTRLRDLVYRVEGDQMEGTDEERAWVQLVFLHGPEGEERELLFRREITPAGSSEYSINGKVVSWDAYDARLQKFGILVKARNFLVFQVPARFTAFVFIIIIIFEISLSTFYYLF